MSANCFAEDLKWSESQHSADWWEPYYHKAFPGLTSIINVQGPSAAQRAGVDKFVMLSGKKIAIDEKIRRDRAPTDIAIEFKHVDCASGEQRDGWICKRNQFTDFLAMGFVKYKVAFFFPFLTMCSAWNKHGKSWCETYPIAIAPNPRIEPRYHTHSACVPTEVLMGCILDAMRIQL